MASINGMDLMAVAKLLGFPGHKTTTGYAHLADDRLVEAAANFGTTVTKAMCKRNPKPEVASADMLQGCLPRSR